MAANLAELRLAMTGKALVGRDVLYHFAEEDLVLRGTIRRTRVRGCGNVEICVHGWVRKVTSSPDHWIEVDDGRKMTIPCTKVDFDPSSLSFEADTGEKVVILPEGDHLDPILVGEPTVRFTRQEDGTLVSAKYFIP